MKQANILAIDFGGMSVKYHLFNNGKELDSVVSPSQPLYEVPKLIHDIKEKFNAFAAKHGKVMGIAMSFNSPVIDGCKVRWGLIHGFWEYFDIKKLIEDAGIIKRDAIRILNDAKAAGYAELKVGAAIGEDNVVVLTYGTAIGGAAYINGEVVNGPFGLGAELSNPLLGFDGQSFSSLRLWTHYGSMSFLEDKYSELAKVRKPGKDIFALYDHKDPIAMKAVDLLYKGIAIHVFNCCYIYGPSSIVIGGGLSNRATAAKEIEVYVRQIEKQMSLVFPCKIKLAKTGNKAGAIGAYHYFLETHK